MAGQRRRAPRRVSPTFAMGLGGVVALSLVSGALYLLEVGRQENEIWAAVAMWFYAQGKHATVSSTTSIPAGSDLLRDADIVECLSSGEPIEEVLRAFRRRNLRQRRVIFGLPEQPRDEDVNRGSMLDRIAQRILDSGDPKAPRSNRLVFSRVGIDKEGAALVYAEYLCPLCGYGGYFFLEESGTEWLVVDVCTAWES